MGIEIDSTVSTHTLQDINMVVNMPSEHKIVILKALLSMQGCYPKYVTQIDLTVIHTMVDLIMHCIVKLLSSCHSYDSLALIPWPCLCDFMSVMATTWLLEHMAAVTVICKDQFDNQIQTNTVKNNLCLVMIADENLNGTTKC